MYQRGTTKPPQSEDRAMITHSKSKKTAKATPQVESTVFISGTTAKLIPCTARQDFQVGNSQVKAGEKFFLIKSERRENRYYVTHFNADLNTYQCSCGANCCEHEHLKTAREHVMNKVVIPAKSSALVPMSVPATVAQVKAARKAKAEQSNEVIDGSRPLTADEWKAIAKRDKARQKAEKAKDWATIEAAREQSRKEASMP